MTDSILVSGDRTATGERSLSLPAWLVLICIIAFTTLLAAGAAIWKNAPPVPDVVRSAQQEIILTRADIQLAIAGDGRTVQESLHLQQRPFLQVKRSL